MLSQTLNCSSVKLPRYKIVESTDDNPELQPFRGKFTLYRLSHKQSPHCATDNLLPTAEDRSIRKAASSSLQPILTARDMHQRHYRRSAYHRENLTHRFREGSTGLQHCDSEELSQ